MNRKKEILHLQIPTPCHQDRSTMDAGPEGFFCHSCEKEVIDFRNKSPRDIRLYFENNKGKVCGLFREDQMHQPLQPLRENRSSAGLKLAALALSALTASQGCIMGETAKPDKNASVEQVEKGVAPAALQKEENTHSDLPANRISGQVWTVCADTSTYDNSWGELTIKNTDLKIKVAEDGRFSFDLPANFRQDTIELQLHGRALRSIERKTLPVADCQVFFPMSIMGDVVCRPRKKKK